MKRGLEFKAWLFAYYCQKRLVSTQKCLDNPVKIKDKFYMFMINEKEPKREQGLEEVRQQVENEYHMQKEQQIVRSLLDKALEQQEVEILYQPKIENEKTSK